MPDIPSLPSSLVLDSVFGSLTVQGPPRYGRRQFGVPPGGCFQPEVLSALNQALGADRAACGLELYGGSFAMELRDPLWLAAGPECLIKVGRTRLLHGYPNCLPAGSVVTVSTARRCYVALGGGLANEPGQSLRAGDELAILERGAMGQVAPLVFGPRRLVLEVSPGDARFEWFFGQEWVVSRHLDRVGIRLEGEGKPHAIELPSQPATFGTIQVTPSGGVIILGPDGPTIGGYPQAGTVLSHSLGELAQVIPGDRLRFSAKPM